MIILSSSMNCSLTNWTSCTLIARCSFRLKWLGSSWGKVSLLGSLTMVVAGVHSAMMVHFAQVRRGFNVCIWLGCLIWTVGTTSVYFGLRALNLTTWFLFWKFHWYRLNFLILNIAWNKNIGRGDKNWIWSLGATSIKMTSDGVNCRKEESNTCSPNSASTASVYISSCGMIKYQFDIQVKFLMNAFREPLGSFFLWRKMRRTWVLLALRSMQMSFGNIFPRLMAYSI